MEEIRIKGARIHNLKNVDITIPKRKLVVITGISGSGKSSLAFDVLFEEGKNQYLNSLGILAGLEKEERFDEIEGIGPAIAIKQNVIRQNNPRSTVGTKSGILNQLSLIYTSDGISLRENNNQFSPSHFLYTTADGMCVNCQGRGVYYDVNIEKLIPNKETTLIEVYENMKVTPGFLRILKKKFGAYFEMPFWDIPEEIREEIIYGTFEQGKQSYCIERILKNAHEKGMDVEEMYSKTTCSACNGERIEREAREVTFYGKSIGQLGQMTIKELAEFLKIIPLEKISCFGKNIIKKISTKLDYMIQFRLGHLTLYRELCSLSGGELQRVFLCLHLQSNMDSLLYVFDEPMSGLHPSEKHIIIQAVKKLRDLGNTVIVVEHDKEMMKQADYIIEIGPKAGVEGGQVVYLGDYKKYQKCDTLLSKYLSDSIELFNNMNRKFKFEKDDLLVIEHANNNNLKDITVKFPLHALVAVVGVSGSGKSSLIEENLLKRLTSAKKYGYTKGIAGTEKINGFVKISQEPIGRSANSTPATYIGIWDKIRELFANQEAAKKNKMTPGDFSFHSKGACLDCKGSGFNKIFLTSNFSVDKICSTCHGKRFNKDTLEIQYKGKTISDILDMSISEAIHFFADQKSIIRPLVILEQMGMGYLTLGQPTSSLSGGEAQRVKLSKELGKEHMKNMLYVLDEPTTGLSLYDIELLIKLLDKLVTNGNSVIIIEHNVEVLKCCDYLIELGPEGGDNGGRLIACGTPEELINNCYSNTGRYL